MSSSKSARRLTISSRLYGITISASTLLLVLCPLCIDGYDLCTCNQLSCEPPVNCTHGTLSDQCGCCMVCARGAGEVCGGTPDGAGVCGEGLQCVIRNKPGDLVTGKEQGICQEIALGCDASACDSIVTHRCPSDSILIHNGTQEDNQCCKTTYECRCNISVCKVPHCATGHTPQIVRLSKKRPGSCCDHYHCKVSGCRSTDGKVYKNGEPWKEGDCITCLCVEGEKQCQAEMCVKKCHSPKYVAGRCCPICESPSLYPHQPSSKCPSLSECNITCETGLQQTPDGCHVCKCKPVDCYKDCRYGYLNDELGQEMCECHKYLMECPGLNKCSKHCSHGYKLSRKGCPLCRCNKCSAASCYENCSHGYQMDRNGCRICKCQDLLWEKNCTVNDIEYKPGSVWPGLPCEVCTCKPNGTVSCQPLTCPMLPCMLKKDGYCCPVCLNISISQVNASDKVSNKTSNECNDFMEKIDLDEVETKYIIALSIVGTLLVIVLILVFVLLYMKLKQHKHASWTVAGQDVYCKCPLFMGHSPVSQHRFNISKDKLVYSAVVQKYDHPGVEMSLKSNSSLAEQKSFLPTSDLNNGQDFNNAKNEVNFTSNGTYDKWADV